MKRSRQRAEQGRDGEYPRVQRQTQLVVAQRRERNLASEQLPAAGKDGKAQCSKCQELAPDGPEKNVARVAHGVHVGMAQLELNQQPRGVRGEDAEEHDDDQARYHAYHGERRRQREHPI